MIAPSEQSPRLAGLGGDYFTDISNDTLECHTCQRDDAKLANIPKQLTGLARWVCWRHETRNGKPTKVPYDANTGGMASTTDPSTWSSFEKVLEVVDQYDGIGFVFNGDGIMGIDHDHVIDPSGNLDPETAVVVEHLGSYTEISQSGRGLHTICFGTLPDDKGRKKVLDKTTGRAIEFYAKGRFFVMTGKRWPGTPATVEHRESHVDALYRMYFPPTTKQKSSPAGQPVDIDDSALMEMAIAAENGDKFSLLWRGDWQDAGYGSQSEADAALLSMLRFWTGGDKERAFRLFGQSGLNRDKWMRSDYRESTWKAIDSGPVYDPGYKNQQSNNEGDNPTTARNGDAWPDIDARTVYDPLPVFPVNILPPVLARITLEISNCAKVPMDLAAITVVSVAGLCCGRDIYTQIKTGVRVRPNTYALCFVARGERKSTVFEFVMGAVHRWVQSNEDKYKSYLGRRDMRSARIVKLKELLANPRTTPADYKKYETTLNTLEGENRTDVVRSPLILAEDSTNEAMIKQMAATGGTIGLFSDDARFTLQIITGLYSGGQSRESMLIKCYDGTTPLNDDRATRGRIVVERPFAALLLMVQNDWLRKLGEQADMLESGFMSRNLFCVADSWVGKRDASGKLIRAFDEAGIDPDINQAYERFVWDSLQAAYERTEPVEVSISPEGRALWIEYFDNVEASLSEDGQYGKTADFAIRYPTNALRLALQFAICNEHNRVEENDVMAGIVVMDHFTKHAERAWQVMKQFNLPEPARRILRHVKQHKIGILSVRDARHNLNLGSIEQTEEAFNALVRRGYCRQADTKGKKSPTFEINPAVHQK